MLYFPATYRFFRDTDCDTSTSLNAVPANTCYGTYKYTCAGSKSY